MSPVGDPSFAAGLRPIPSDVRRAGDPPARFPAPDLVGTDPAGDRLEIRIDGTATTEVVLLVFLATRCDGCDEFWRGFSGSGRELPPGIEPVIVTRGPDVASRSDVADRAGGTEVPVIMSDAAWVDYRVSGYPFLVLVESASRTIVAETVGFGWADLESLVRSRSH